MLQNTGERQVAPTLDEIRKDHTERYRWAVRQVKGTVLDLGCGIAYGSKILADSGRKVFAYDVSEDALAYGKKHYPSKRVTHIQQDLGQDPEFQEADYAVCFEMIEHVDDPSPMLKALHGKVGKLIASVPNEEVFPYNNYAFHKRHYTKAQFAELLLSCGWEPMEWFGQQGPESPVEKDCNGRTLIAICRPWKAPELVNIGGDKHPDLTGKHVAILGLGPSVNEYVDIVKRIGNRHKYADEIWGINAVGGVLQCDRIIHMDDVRIQEIRAAERPKSNIASMLEWMRTTNIPIVTSRKHENYPTTIDFPLEDVLNSFGFAYFNGTAAYAMAYAIYTNAAHISVFGCDYTYANTAQAEAGRACLEFWMGRAGAHGIRITLPQTTSLMDSCMTPEARLYGYDTVDVHIQGQEDNSCKVFFTEKELLPTADEIEARYDHSAHPNPIVRQQNNAK